MVSFFRSRRLERERRAAVRRGELLFTNERNEEALTFLDGAVAKFPSDPELWMLRASASLSLRPDDVTSSAAEAVKLGADDPDMQVRGGHLLLSRGDIGAASRCAARARELAGPDFVLMAGLEGLEGNLASLAGEYERAEKLYRSAVAREPEYATYAVDLARFLKNRGRKAESLAVVDDALGKVKNRGELERMRKDIAAGGAE